MWILRAVHEKLDVLVARTAAIRNEVQHIVSDLHIVLETQDQILRNQANQHIDVVRRLEALEALLTPPPGPGAPPSFNPGRPISERMVGNMRVVLYEFDVPAVPDTGAGEVNEEVATHRFRAKVDGADWMFPEVGDHVDVPKDSTTVKLEFKKNGSVSMLGSYVEDDGLEGEVVEVQNFIAAGDIPPGAPGAFGAGRVISERDVPDNP